MTDEVTPAELAERLRLEPDLLLVDVREPVEWAICRLDGARLAPLATVVDTLAEVPLAQPIVLYCHHGVRSLTALQLLRRRGYTALWSLAGGIDAWALEVDPSLARY